jgi:hypothetical protein
MADTCGPGRLARAALAFGRFDTLAFEPPRCTLCLIRAFSPWILPQLRHVPTRSTDQAAEHEDHPYDNCPARCASAPLLKGSSATRFSSTAIPSAIAKPQPVAGKNLPSEFARAGRHPSGGQGGRDGGAIPRLRH